MKLSAKITVNSFLVGAALIASASRAPAAHAQASLQINPLKYEDKLVSDKVHSGFIDVANPGDTTVRVKSNVQGFRQADLDGNLTFFDSDTLKSAIKTGLSEFDVGPRESIRISFTVEPKKLPQGGIYAAIFFRTVPQQASTNTNSIFESANIGTLLLLQNGKDQPNVGQIYRTNLPLLQFGNGIKGTIEYKNISNSVNGTAFYPKLKSKVYPWGKASGIKGPFIMPGSIRKFSFNKTGSYLGIIPVIISDNNTNKYSTAWVIAATGWWRWLLLTVFVAMVMTASITTLRKLPLLRKKGIKYLFKP